MGWVDDTRRLQRRVDRARWDRGLLPGGIQRLLLRRWWAGAALPLAGATVLVAMSRPLGVHDSQVGLVVSAVLMGIVLGVQLRWRAREWREWRQANPHARRAGEGGPDWYHRVSARNQARSEAANDVYDLFLTAGRHMSEEERRARRVRGGLIALAGLLPLGVEALESRPS